MRIEGVIWLADVVEKLAVKHHVRTDEVEELLSNRPLYRFAQRGMRKGENVYTALGQTDAGRYLVVVFIQKRNRKALILSARDMARKERKRYGKN